MRNKVSALTDTRPPVSRGRSAPFLNTSLCCRVAEAPLPRAATGGAGGARRAARGLRGLLHLAVSTVTDAHARRSALLLPREAVPPLLPTPPTADDLTAHTPT